MKTHRHPRIVGTLLIVLAALPSLASAQVRPGRFQRREQAVELPVTVFHSTQAANLPTAETLAKGEMLFEISHRFLPAISDGVDALWGFDGPVQNRLGLAFAASDRVMLGVSRANLDDNLELNAKARLWEKRSGGTSIMVAAMSGIAWNTEAPIGAGADDNESQAYGQVVIDVLLGEKFAVGLVPTVLYNPRIESASTETVLALGGHGQLYLSDHMSLLAEWIKSGRRTGLENDSGTFGIELETGGHFFKIVITNQTRMNPTQYLGGSPNKFEADEWRVGFNITRILVF